MKFKIDENLPEDLCAILLTEGHDAHSVHDEELSGANDTTISQVCQTEGRILITLDLDFAHIINFPPTSFPGIIVIRLVRQDKAAVLAIIPRILLLLKTERIAERLWIVDNDRTRIRGSD